MILTFCSISYSFLLVLLIFGIVVQDILNVLQKQYLRWWYENQFLFWIEYKLISHKKIFYKIPAMRSWLVEYIYIEQWFWAWVWRKYSCDKYLWYW